ncbi:MAG: endonuclease III [Bacteroidota bacterium]|jgi:endonuclease-3
MKESIKKKTLRLQSIYQKLVDKYPQVECALLYSNPFELLIATILSAQCTDARVNMVTPILFNRYPDVFALADASIEELESIIYSTGFYKAKSANIIACCKSLVEKYQGNIPKSIDELQSLAGVGRKTANVVLGNAFGINAGITVDTHVKRVMSLLGITTSQNAEIVERDLMKIISQDEWTNFTHRIIAHGRETCIARRPKCNDCILNTECFHATNQKGKSTQ